MVSSRVCGVCHRPALPDSGGQPLIFDQPYFRPGAMPIRFFTATVMPTAPVIFITGTLIRSEASRTVRGTQ